VSLIICDEACGSQPQETSPNTMDSRPCMLPQMRDRGVCSARVYHVEVYCIVTGTSGASKNPAISTVRKHQEQTHRARIEWP